MSKGKFIVFEGIECSGKTTQSKMLREYFIKQKIPVHLTQECSNGPIGKVIREYYLSGQRRINNKKLLNLLFMIDRLDHLTNPDDGIINILTNGINVICDRYYLSSLAYHISSYEKKWWDIEMNYIYEENLININLLDPTITIYIDTDPDVAFTRLIARTESKREIFDTPETFKKLHETYEESINFLLNKNNIIFSVDGNRDKMDVFSDILKIVQANCNLAI